MMPSRNLLIPCLRLTGTLSLLLMPILPAQATAGLDYVRLRGKLQYNRTLTYENVSTTPQAYKGTVLELRGIVGGMVSGDNLMVVLNTPDKNAINLDIPSNEAKWIQQLSNPALRVLVEVGEAGVGNTVPLKVVAVSHESEVSAVETAVANEERERLKQMVERQRRDARSILARNHANPYRGNPLRGVPMTQDIQRLAEHYMARLKERVRPIFIPYMNFIMSHNPRLGAQKAAHIAANLLHFSDQYDVDPRLVVAMIIAESDFDPNSTSRTGAMGLGQLMPGTARSLGVSNAYDPAQNLEGSIHYLRNRLDLYKNRSMTDGGMTFEQIRLALAAYNAGAAAVKKHGGVPPFRETQAYVRRIETLYRQLTGQ